MTPPTSEPNEALRQHLQPGVNVDPVDVDSGVARASNLGFSNHKEMLVVRMCLNMWAGGREAEAENAFLKEFGNGNFTAWRMILTHAIVKGREQLAVQQAADQKVAQPEPPRPMTRRERASRVAAVRAIMLTFDCDYCHAEPKERCVTKSGDRTTDPHMARYQAAVDAGLLPLGDMKTPRPNDFDDAVLDFLNEGAGNRPPHGPSNDDSYGRKEAERDVIRAAILRNGQRGKRDDYDGFPAAMIDAIMETRQFTPEDQEVVYFVTLYAFNKSGNLLPAWDCGPFKTAWSAHEWGMQYLTASQPPMQKTGGITKRGIWWFGVSQMSTPRTSNARFDVTRFDVATSQTIGGPCATGRISLNTLNEWSRTIRLTLLPTGVQGGPAPVSARMKANQ